MIDITPASNVLDELLKRAHRFNEFRKQCVAYLTACDRYDDKFTVNVHERLLGYVSERAVTDWLRAKVECVTSVECWQGMLHQGRTTSEVYATVQAGRYDTDSINAVSAYFYDQWDLRIATSHRSVTCDVKTAVTEFVPRETWDFFYPVRQALSDEPNAPVILVYCVCAADDDPDTLTKVYLAGLTTKRVIRGCPELRKGEVSRFGTKCLVDNYVTSIKQHYIPVEQFLCA